MSAKITDLVIRLRNQIRDNGATQAFPDTGGVAGTSPELQQFIQDSLGIYSKYRPRRRSTTLTLQPGTTTYSMPADWMTVDSGSFQQACQPAPLPDPDVYALPFIYTAQPLGVQLNTINFRWYDDDQQLTLGSDPLQTFVLTFDYYAYHTADSTGSTVPAPMLYYALLPAAENALRAIATDYAAKLQKYKVGGRTGMEIDDSKITDNLLNEALSYRTIFEKEVIFKPYATSGGDDRWH
ncbi:MAG: phage adaptor protein [Desulfitobacteriaceae bacterium]